ncbi:MAG: MFS transporter [Candidatus Lokiarchaeota archaeon]|nr:MFS transporter [Candidatus Lokiarchaeota archaeon]
MSLFHNSTTEIETVNKLEVDNIQRSKSNSNIAKLYFFNFLIGFSLISGVLIPFYIIYGGFTFFEFMLLQSYYALMLILLEIPCGIIADRIGKKFALTLAAVSFLLIPFVYGIIPSKFLFFIGETLFAFSFALISGTNEAIIIDTLKVVGKEKRVMKVVALNDGMFLLGIIISAPIGSIIANFVSIQFIILLMIIPYCLSLIITLMIHKTSIEGSVKRKSAQILKSGIKLLWKNKILKILIFEKIIIEILIVFLVFTYQYYILIEFNIPIFYFGFIEAGLMLSQFTFLNIIPHLANSAVHKKKILLINTIVPGIGYLLISITNFVPVVIFLFLIVIGLGLSRYIIFTNGINRLIQQDNRATILSSINVISGTLKAILYPLIGFLIMININFLYLLLGVIILLIALKSKVKKEYL